MDYGYSFKDNKELYYKSKKGANIILWNI